jgi:hypothetical protein
MFGFRVNQSNEFTCMYTLLIKHVVGIILYDLVSLWDLQKLIGKFCGEKDTCTSGFGSDQHRKSALYAPFVHIRNLYLLPQCPTHPDYIPTLLADHAAPR